MARAKPKPKPKRKSGMAATKSKPPLKPGKDGIVRLSGGNPQVAKADGDAPVQKYIAAMPGWKSAVGKRLDAITVRAVPHVRKAVKWNTPLYGIEGRGWFMGFRVLAKFVKGAFFCGASLKPLPPGPSKQKNVRYLDIYEDDELDEEQFLSWAKQASELPGEWPTT